jgi:hypothetical protein
MKHRDFPTRLDWILGGLVAAVVAIGMSHDAHAQTVCPAAPADPIPRDAVRLTLVPSTTWVEGGAIVGPLTYTLYELVGTTWTQRCTTSAVAFGQTGLAVGAHTWAVTAKTQASQPPNIESVRSPQASKTIPPAPLTPNAPITFTVEGTVVITGAITLTPQ